MTLLLDVHLSPALAPWVKENFNIECSSFESLGWRFKGDEEIFFLARKSEFIIVTKDEDFVRLVGRHKAPPRVIWLTCGNTFNSRLKEIFSAQLPVVLELLKENDLVEIKG